MQRNMWQSLDHKRYIPLLEMIIFTRDHDCCFYIGFQLIHAMWN